MFPEVAKLFLESSADEKEAERQRKIVMEEEKKNGK